MAYRKEQSNVTPNNAHLILLCTAGFNVCVCTSSICTEINKDKMKSTEVQTLGEL